MSSKRCSLTAEPPNALFAVLGGFPVARWPIPVCPQSRSRTGNPRVRLPTSRPSAAAIKIAGPPMRLAPNWTLRVERLAFAGGETSTLKSNSHVTFATQPFCPHRTLELRRRRRSFRIPCAGVAELADALDSKSSDRKIVWVRAPPPAQFVGVGC